MVILCVWLFGHLFDSNLWYNRNLAIVANIERQFLRPEDAKLIHPYFVQYRSSDSLLGHFLVTAYLAGSLWFIVLLWHFWHEFDQASTSRCITLSFCGQYLTLFRALESSGSLFIVEDKSENTRSL
jgi:hypothetical protein